MNRRDFIAASTVFLGGLTELWAADRPTPPPGFSYCGPSYPIPPPEVAPFPTVIPGIAKPVQPPRQKVLQPVYFGPVWVETGLGYTTVRHLVNVHGLTRDQLAPYANDRNALNRLHGWKHTGRGVAVPVTVKSSKASSSCPSGSCPIQKRIIQSR